MEFQFCVKTLKQKNLLLKNLKNGLRSLDKKIFTLHTTFLKFVHLYIRGAENLIKKRARPAKPN